MAETPQEITSVVGREIYSTNGVYVGEVKDIGLNLDDEHVTDLAVTHPNPELFEDLDRGSHGVLIPYRWVRNVGDVVLVNDIVERLREAEEEKILA